MEGRVCLCFLSVLLLLAAPAPAPALTKETVRYFADGDTLVLTPSHPQEIKRILWKIDGNLVAEWLGGTYFEYYGRFNGRTTLDPTTGRLEISNMGPADQGLFTVEINSVALDEQFKAERLERVPRPEVAPQPPSCDLPSFACNLTCTGEVPEKTLTYSWRMGGEEWEDGERSLLFSEELRNVTSFSCRLKNRVSEEESAPFPNPLL